MTATKAAPKKRRPPLQSGGHHFEAFCAAYCRHTKGPLRGEPVTFEPWQRRYWKEALKLDKTGTRVYSFTLSGRPRKNYKTTECAALGLYMAGPEGEPGPEVAIGSGSLDQAGFVFNQARAFVENSPELSRTFKTQANVILAPALSGVLMRVAAEGRLQMGLNLSAAILDELHVFQTPRERDLYSALVTASGIREQPLISAITTAGFDLHSLLGEIYSAALKLDDVTRTGRFQELIIARDPAAGFLMYWYGAPEGADIENRALWRAVNPGKAVRMEFLERQFTSPHVSEGEFRRYHLNQWTASHERWIADSVWRAGASEVDPTAFSEVYLGVDAAITHDTTALDMAFVMPDGSGRVLHVSRVWAARPDAPHDVLVPGGRIDNALVEEFVMDVVAKRWRIKELVYDPRFFEETATRLGRQGIRVAPILPGSGLMTEATANFYVDCQEGRVLHLAGEEGGVLTQHVEAAVANKTDRGWRLSKIKSTRPIDALIAMVIAHSRARRGSESVYERRGLLVLGDDAVERRDSYRKRLMQDDDD